MLCCCRIWTTFHFTFCFQHYSCHGDGHSATSNVAYLHKKARLRESTEFPEHFHWRRAASIANHSIWSGPLVGHFRCREDNQDDQKGSMVHETLNEKKKTKRENCENCPIDMEGEFSVVIRFRAASFSDFSISISTHNSTPAVSGQRQVGPICAHFHISIKKNPFTSCDPFPGSAIPF